MVKPTNKQIPQPTREEIAETCVNQIINDLQNILIADQKTLQEISQLMTELGRPEDTDDSYTPTSFSP